MSRKHLALGLVSAVLCGQLLLTSFQHGWTHMATDFPNYYTAAVLTLQRQPLRNFYDWTWFQRQINYAGVERQLGAYTPHTPLTMLPLLPLAVLEPQRAKQAWLVLELLFLAASVLMLSRLTGFHPTEILVLALLARSALSANLDVGQYYIFLLFLLTLSAWCIVRARPFTGGALVGVIFALKLYAAPFLFYFAVRRQWKALWGMIVSVAVLASAAIGIFGFDAIWFFVTTVMARGLDGSVNDPYNPGWGSMTAFLRHTLVPEAELNPHPMVVAPALFFFLRAFYTMGVLALSLLALSRASWDEGRAFAWFVIVLFALSPNTASYHFILLLVPVAFLLRGGSLAWSAGVLILYALIELPLRPWYSWLFPKAWLLPALLLYSGWWNFRAIRGISVISTLVLVSAASAADAWRRWNSYRNEPPQVAAHAVICPGNIFSSGPVIGAGEMIYQAMAGEMYVLRVSNSAGIRTFMFDGEAFHPTVSQPAGPIHFELVAHRHSRICKFDPATKGLEVIVGPELDPSEPAVSTDGKKLAFVSDGSLFVREGGRLSKIVPSRAISGPTFFPDGERIAFAEGQPGRRLIHAVPISGGEAQTLTKRGDCTAPAVSPDGTLLAYAESETGARQVWIQDLVSGTRWPVTSGACNNDSPAWHHDSRTIVFASDCSRGLGLPALYTISVEPRHADGGPQRIRAATR